MDVPCAHNLQSFQDPGTVRDCVEYSQGAGKGGQVPRGLHCKPLRLSLSYALSQPLTEHEGQTPARGECVHTAELMGVTSTLTFCSPKPFHRLTRTESCKLLTEILLSIGRTWRQEAQVWNG